MVNLRGVLKNVETSEYKQEMIVDDLVLNKRARVQEFRRVVVWNDSLPPSNICETH